MPFKNMLNKLSGWTRLIIVISIIWFFIAYPICKSIEYRCREEAFTIYILTGLIIIWSVYGAIIWIIHGFKQPLEKHVEKDTHSEIESKISIKPALQSPPPGSLAYLLILTIILGLVHFAIYIYSNSEILKNVGGGIFVLLPYLVAMAAKRRNRSFFYWYLIGLLGTNIFVFVLFYFSAVGMFSAFLEQERNIAFSQHKQKTAQVQLAMIEVERKYQLNNNRGQTTVSPKTLILRLNVHPGLEDNVQAGIN